MENKLIPLTEFVNRIDELVPMDNEMWQQKQLMTIKRYSAFLSQPLKLEYFVPVRNGNVLEEPDWWYRYCNGASPFMNMDEIRPCQKYSEALDRRLFEGFECKRDKEGEYVEDANDNTYFPEYFNNGKINPQKNRIIG